MLNQRWLRNHNIHTTNGKAFQWEISLPPLQVSPEVFKTSNQLDQKPQNTQIPFSGKFPCHTLVCPCWRGFCVGPMYIHKLTNKQHEGKLLLQLANCSWCCSYMYIYIYSYCRELCKLIRHSIKLIYTPSGIKCGTLGPLHSYMLNGPTFRDGDEIFFLVWPTFIFRALAKYRELCITH